MWIVAVVVGVIAGVMSCAHVDPNRAPCLDRCAKAKDECMLSASTPDAVHACDASDGTCVEACPR
jgi:hypothetical protein